MIPDLEVLSEYLMCNDRKCKPQPEAFSIHSSLPRSIRIIIVDYVGLTATRWTEQWDQNIAKSCHSDGICESSPLTPR
jgi:hypothetical protein